MLETFIGAVIGILASVVVSRYYYRRSLQRSLAVYSLLDSQVFAGIHEDVRTELDFRFRARQVRELQQIMFLVANDGDRAITQPLEPLTLRATGVEVLDASIVHSSPETLKAAIGQTADESGNTVLRFEFPLLNGGDFFVVKMLLSGYMARSAQVFEVTAEDLPRRLAIKPMPLDWLSDSEPHVEWGAAAAGVTILAIASWVWFALYLVFEPRPAWLPYPWASFHPSIRGIIVGIPGALLAIALTIVGFMALVAAPFGGSFPPGKRRFLVPTSVKRAAGRYWTQEIHVGGAADFLNEPPSTARSVDKRPVADESA